MTKQEIIESIREIDSEALDLMLSKKMDKSE